jgi:SSS family solute:Na+ symporter
MHFLDWLVLSLYFTLLIGISLWIGMRQKSGTDYFLGGKRLRSGIIALSLAANQVSAISLIGAPAFVALRPDGGLKWLQYEFAVPLAMIAIMLLIVPLFRRLAGASIFEYLGKRFGLSVQLTMSAVFMVSRGLATGIVLYTSALVLSVTLSLSILLTLSLMGLIAIIYTTIGGITADILSDALQLVILFIGTIAALLIAAHLVGGFEAVSDTLGSARTTTIEFSKHGLGDNEDFALLPMLIGGFFLYFSYYGCDQSQAQRIMSTPSRREARSSLMLNGLIRFPVVLAYCGLGLLLAVFIAQNPQWAASHDLFKPGEINKLVPFFIIDYLPVGVIGLVMAGIFAATMSSIDSNINSLSAVTMHDFIARFQPLVAENEEKFLLLSRIMTAGWGLFCVVSGYLIAQSGETVIVLVNKIGSLFYGPILAVFLAGALIKRATSTGVLTGLIAGLAANLTFFLFIPSVSWLWWNVIGFLGAFGLTAIISVFSGDSSPDSNGWTLREILDDSQKQLPWFRNYQVWILIVAFALIVFITWSIGNIFS